MINLLGLVTIISMTFIGAMNEKIDGNNCLQLEVLKREEILVKVLKLIKELPQLHRIIESLEKEFEKPKYSWFYTYEDEIKELQIDIHQHQMELNKKGKNVALQTEELIDGLQLTAINCKYLNSSEPKDILKKFDDQNVMLEELSGWICDVKTEDEFNVDKMYNIEHSLEYYFNPYKR